LHPSAAKAALVPHYYGKAEAVPHKPYRKKHPRETDGATQTLIEALIEMSLVGRGFSRDIKAAKAGASAPDTANLKGRVSISQLRHTN
jgi:hypothetical protein